MAASWSDFARAAPEIAAGAEAAFARYEVVVLGTTPLRGAPRLSLVEPRVLDGRLLFGTTGNDPKSRDLLREPGCSLHTLVSHRTHVEPVFKAELLAFQVEPAEASEIADELARPEIRWRPSAVFVLEVVAAALIIAGRSTAWQP